MTGVIFLESQQFYGDLLGMVYAIRGLPHFFGRPLGFCCSENDLHDPGFATNLCWFSVQRMLMVLLFDDVDHDVGHVGHVGHDHDCCVYHN